MTPAFRRMDASMEEASRMSGASALTTMVRITVPAMTPVIIVVFLLSVIRIFSSFEIELLLGVPWGFYVYSTKIVDLARQEPPLVNQAAALGSVILDLSRRLHSNPAQTYRAPPIHHGDRPVQTEDHRSRRLALSGDGVSSAWWFSFSTSCRCSACSAAAS